MKEKLRIGICLLALAWVAVFGSGCATMNKMIGSIFGKDSPSATDPKKSNVARFSETDKVPYNNDLAYRRMNRNRFEEEADVAASAGSLWVMEGQGAYLFAQNTTRLIGDILNVRVDGNPKAQLSTKTRVIAKLLAKLDRPEQKLRTPASAAAAKTPTATQTNQPMDPNAQQQPQDPNNPQAQNANGQQPAQAIAAPQATVPETPFAVEAVPTRIVEVLRDGSYRIRGTQEFMIGKREYRVIVTGIVRQEDFNEEGISAEKLLDSQFDIVSAKRGTSL